MKKATNQFFALVLLVLLINPTSLLSQVETSPKSKPITLKHWMTPEEAKLKNLIGKNARVTDPPVGPVTNFAEFDKMQSVLIRYSFGISYALIAEMSQECRVTTVVASNSEKTYVTNQYQNQGVNVANCDFLIAPSDSYWTRDYGPWFVIDGNNEIGIVDFTYNRPRPNDDAIPGKVAQMLGINLFEMDIETAGGNYMTDGMGISASSDLIWVENPSYTHTQIAQIFEDYLGIGMYHVLDDPNNTYIDHIDCWGKYLDVDKVLIRSVPTSHAQYDELEATAAYFEQQLSSFGTPYQVFRVYTPNDQPYTNSLILNKRVFVPIMNSQWDDEAIASYQEAMPGYEILGFTGSWESTDALHCRAIGIADVDQVHIRHIPILGEQPVQGSYPVQAEIHAFSGQTLNTDSVLIYYRINGSAWQNVNLSQGSGDIWSGSIPGASAGSQIDYYLFAADMAGNGLNHPFIGQPDPHTFFVGSQAFAQIAVNPSQITTTATVGQVVTENLLIQNTGDLELNYQLSTNTAVYGEINQTVPNSPSASSFDFNTYTELGWTNIAVTSNGEIAGIEISFTWSTDNWPEEGSFHLESPSGVQSVVVSGIPDGVYNIDLTDFNGEDLNGTWKMWIEDTYGDGGHQATAITIKFTTVISSEPWLITQPSSGTVQPGGSTTIAVTCDANNLTVGLHQGTISITSNDPNNPEIEVPVNFDVTMADDITVTPDTLWFLTFDDMINGKMLNINNFTTSEIDITGITEWGSFVPWMFEQPLPQMPYSMSPGSELSLKVVIAIPPDIRTNMIYDNLIVTSEIGPHTVVVAWDSDLINSSIEVSPDTLWFETPAQAWVDGIEFSVENSGNLPVYIENIPEEGDFWIIPEMGITLPYTLAVGETISFNVFVSVVPVTDGYIYDFIPVITQLAGEYQVIVAINENLLTEINEIGCDITAQISPNPFTDDLLIVIDQKSEKLLAIEVLDNMGRKIRSLSDFDSNSSINSVKWDGKDNQNQKVKNGIYFIKIQTNSGIKINKVIKK